MKYDSVSKRKGHRCGGVFFLIGIDAAVTDAGKNNREK